MNTLHKTIVLGILIQVPIFGMDKNSKDTLWRSFNWGLKIGCGTNLIDGQKQPQQPTITPAQEPYTAQSTSQTTMSFTSYTPYHRHARPERSATKLSPQAEKEIQKRIAEAQLFNLIEKKKRP